MSTQLRKRGRPAKQVLKARQNITITPTVLKKAKRMAFVDGLSLSSWIEQLVREKLETSNASNA
jgi:predicted HicB family RNase H-like nuclease